MQNKIAKLWKRNISDSESKGIKSLEGTLSALYSPMVCEGNVSGVIHVDSTHNDNMFDQYHLKKLSCLANILANAVCIKKNTKTEQTIKILFLSANPKETKYLRIYEEIKKVDQQDSDHRCFDIEKHFDVKSDEITGLFLHCEPKPQIVYFSGHGTKNGDLIFDNKQVPLKAFAQLFNCLGISILL